MTYPANDNSSQVPETRPVKSMYQQPSNGDEFYAPPSRYVPQLSVRPTELSVSEQVFYPQLCHCWQIDDPHHHPTPSRQYPQPPSENAMPHAVILDPDLQTTPNNIPQCPSA